MFWSSVHVPIDILQQVGSINYDAFGAEDDYSRSRNVANFLVTEPGELMVEFDRKGKVSAYLFYKRSTKDLQSERLAVRKDQRRNGLARKLLRRVLKRAGDLQVPYITYALHANLASINMRFGMGFQVTKIDDTYIWFRKDPKPETPDGDTDGSTERTDTAQEETD